MNQVKRQWASVALLALVWIGAPGQPLAATADINVQRDLYRQARAAIKSGDQAGLRSLLTALGDYPLVPYLEIESLRRGLSRADPAAVRRLLKEHGELPAADDLRYDWLKRLSRERRWADLDADYRPQRSVALRCSYWSAQLALGRPAPLNDDNRDLWLAGRSQPDSCDRLFSHWRRTGQIDAALYWRRAAAAVGAGELRLAGWLGQFIEPRQREDLKRWIELRRNPRSGLTRARHWPDSAVNRRMLAEAIERLIGSDLEAADHHWRQLADHFRWEDDQRIAIPRRIALLRATDYPADALTTLRALPDMAVDQQIREWRVRVALHGGNWRAVLDELDAFEAADRDGDRWRYWRARALAQTGQTAEANALFIALSGEPNFYGFLSAQRTGRPYALCPSLRDPKVDVLAILDKIPAFARAMELFHADQLNLARREWYRALVDQPPEVRRHAAVLADAAGWHERAILTLANAGFLTQYAMRFPLAYPDRVTREAARQRLNPSLVYGVMRSESAMAPDAISGANARGLMQLTPATGRQVARAERLPVPRSSELLDPDRNIRLGSAYLNQLFERFQHPLLVLAAYNAGPRPVERWQSAGMPMEADRWIETVPYHETRDYLSRVLAFATIYDWRRFGRMVPISVRMPPMDAAPGKSDLNARPAIQPACPAHKEQISP